MNPSSCMLLLVVLHTLDGNELAFNPAQVTHMISRLDGKNFAKGTNCMINFSNGKFATVPDSCEDVRKLMVAMNR